MAAAVRRFGRSPRLEAEADPTEERARRQGASRYAMRWLVAVAASPSAGLDQHQAGRPVSTPPSSAGVAIPSAALGRRQVGLQPVMLRRSERAAYSNGRHASARRLSPVRQRWWNSVAGGGAMSSVDAGAGRSGVALAASAAQLGASATGTAAARLLLERLAHACACRAAASLELKGVPHAQPAENLSAKTVRRCRVLQCCLSVAKLAAVYVHSVHVHGEDGGLIGAGRGQRERLGLFRARVHVLEQNLGGSSSSSPSTPALSRRRLSPMRNSGGGESGCCTG
jgi:hypothetical protein